MLFTMSWHERRERKKLPDKLIVKKVKGLVNGELRGSGAYGLVRAVSVRGTTCIAKRTHDILQDPRVPPDERESVKDKFYDECKMLSELRHPNIVHFVGVHYDRRGELTLIMEALHCDLRGFFRQKESTSVTLSVRLSISLDVSYGLLYLHSQQPTAIIHRDLNPGNILLTQDLRAKIGDLGVSRFLNISKEQSMAPGAWDYMPPESLQENPTYDTSLDVFSFGHVILCIANHCLLDISLPSVGGSSQSPIKRRKKYLDSLGHGHCMYSLAVDCLQAIPIKRPATKELCDRLQKLCRTHPRSNEDILKVAEKEKKSQLPSQPTEPPYSDHICTESDSDNITNFMFPSSSNTPPSSDLWWDLENADELETTSSLQQKIEELMAENQDLKVIAETEKATALVYKEDFEAERRDREKAHNDIDNYKFQLMKLQEKFTQMEERHRHQCAEMYVLKAATVRQAEELRKVHLERQFERLKPQTKNKQVLLDRKPLSTTPISPLVFVSPTTSSDSPGGHCTSKGTDCVPSHSTPPPRPLSSSHYPPLPPPLPPRKLSHLRPANSFHDFRDIPDDYHLPGHVYEEIVS